MGQVFETEGQAVTRWATFHRCVAWLAVAAMALIMVAPVVSRSMPVDATMAGMGAGPGMHADNHPHPDTPNLPDDPTAKCGYCVLLDHSPVAGAGVLLFHLPTWRPASPPDAIALQSTPFARFLGARPRGPPSRANS